ncbi:exopolysaccharide biosynthesis protein [Vineibacter terrae]|uniref:exopolysaccharide biosynthesis protein n=1 Tax=Vineibacter terrae TaxID=2586908 RepID=UPI002E2F53D1|nr:exopolysaccharide biosynthesis protein [Vineibacter terrae]HEX2890732.1 exopolysaccharide biosynthesis protein [Vineibacter terrae]
MMPHDISAADRESLVDLLAQLFAGPREAPVTIARLMDDMKGRAYPLVVIVFDIANCIPTGIPWLSTITGIPIVILLGQMLMGYESPTLPAFVAGKSIQRGRLQDFLARARRWIVRLENAVHPRRSGWTTGAAGVWLSLAMLLNGVILALPIPFDNLLPAWAVMFFALALLERDGVMAMAGWAMTLATLVWTALLLFFYSEVMALLPGFARQIKEALFG